jgi:hypothetical protein
MEEIESKSKGRNETNLLDIHTLDPTEWVQSGVCRG